MEQSLRRRWDPEVLRIGEIWPFDRDIILANAKEWCLSWELTDATGLVKVVGDLVDKATKTSADRVERTAAKRTPTRAKLGRAAPKDGASLIAQAKEKERESEVARIKKGETAAARARERERKALERAARAENFAAEKIAREHRKKEELRAKQGRVCQGGCGKSMRANSSWTACICMMYCLCPVHARNQVHQGLFQKHVQRCRVARRQLAAVSDAPDIGSKRKTTSNRGQPSKKRRVEPEALVSGCVDCGYAPCRCHDV